MSRKARKAGPGISAAKLKSGAATQPFRDTRPLLQRTVQAGDARFAHTVLAMRLAANAQPISSRQTIASGHERHCR